MERIVLGRIGIRPERSEEGESEEREHEQCWKHAATGANAERADSPDDGAPEGPPAALRTGTCRWSLQSGKSDIRRRRTNCKRGGSQSPKPAVSAPLARRKANKSPHNRARRIRRVPYHAQFRDDTSKRPDDENHDATMDAPHASPRQAKTPAATATRQPTQRDLGGIHHGRARRACKRHANCGVSS